MTHLSHVSPTAVLYLQSRFCIRHFNECPRNNKKHFTSASHMEIDLNFSLRSLFYDLKKDRK